jgi:DNA-binding CsgD family transcriptional regulator/MFS family permease
MRVQTSPKQLFDRFFGGTYTGSMVDIVTLFFTMLVLVAAVFGFTLALLMVIKTGDVFYRRYLLFISFFTSSIFLFLALIYLRNAPQTPQEIIVFWGLVDSFVDIAILISAAMFFHVLCAVDRSRLRNGMLYFFGLLSLGAMSALAFLGPETEPLPQYSLVGGLALYYGIFLYMISVVVLNWKKLKGFRDRFFGYGLLAFALTGLLEALLFLPEASTASIISVVSPGRFYFNTATYLVWIILSSGYLLQQLLRRGSVNQEIDESALDAFHLTRRERQVLQELITGKSNKAIGDKLYISVQTVKSHVHSIFQKTGATGRWELISLMTQPGKKTKNIRE